MTKKTEKTFAMLDKDGNYIDTYSTKREANTGAGYYDGIVVPAEVTYDVPEPVTLALLRLGWYSQRYQTSRPPQ